MRRPGNPKRAAASRLLESAPSTPATLTPLSSAFPSAYPSENEDESQAKTTPFPFLSLPSEIRNQIYSVTFAPIPAVIDLDPTTFRLIRRLQIFAPFTVSAQLYCEATHQFFSTHTFRIFPIYPGRYFKTKRPLLARLPPHSRSSITSLELRLGPGWNSPPQGWVVNDDLGLTDCTSVRTLKVFVECDPSDSIFAGFRKSEGFYGTFSANLLESLLKGVPSIEVVEFDAYSSVERSGGMMSALGQVVSKYHKVVAWGPERGWNHEGDQVWLDELLIHSGAHKLSKTIAVLA